MSILLHFHSFNNGKNDPNFKPPKYFLLALVTSCIVASILAIIIATA